ncbi:MAG: hypothetical protein RLZZ605_1051, partial [Bacteroidota bacterium]
MIFKISKTILSRVLFIVSISTLIFGTVHDSYGQQTNPTAQNLPYSQNFSSLAGNSTSYPAGWIGWEISANPPSSTGRTSAPTADVAISSGTASSTSSKAYDFNGKIGFLSSASKDVALCLALNTTGITSGIKLNFDIMTIRNPYDGVATTGGNDYLEAVVIQYRTSVNPTTFTSISYSPEYQQNTTSLTSGTTGQQIVSYSITLPSACNNQANVQIRWILRTVSGGIGSRASFAIDNVSAAAIPVVSSSVANIANTDLNYTEGAGPSTPYNFTVSGSYLTANEIVSVPSNSNFELSTTSGGSYTNSISLSPMSGSVTNLTVYVRLKSGLAAGNYSENITIASTGATSQTVALSGIVNPNSPAILSSLSTATFANTAIGSSSASQSATISGSNLQSAISISAPSGFQISTDGTTWSSSASFSPTNNSVSSLLYIRYTPTVNGSNYSGNITLTATGASAVNISVSGYLDKFYYKGTGDLSQVTSWSSTSDGTGTSTPLDFTHNNVYYYILTNATTVSLWTVAGTGSKIILGDPTIPGVSLTTTNGAGISTTSPAVLDVTASSNATPNSLILNDPTNKPTAGSIHSTSELHYRNTMSHGTTGTWAKVFIENNATVTFSSTPTIQTSFTIDNGATLYTNSGSTYCKMNINSNASITINGTVEVLNSAGLSCGNCSSTAGSVFNFNGTPNITFGSNALVKYNRTSAQTIQPFAYPNLEISGTATKTISNSGGNNSIASVLNSLTVGTGATLATGGLLTLKSNASGTARIAQSAGSISGDVNVERYIPQNNNRAWRTLSVPTYGSQTIASSWKLGTLITGPASCTGMDATTNGYSMYTYSASGDSLLGVSSTASAINSSSTSPASYFLYVRGDRNTGLLNANTNPSATTLSTTGSVYQGQVSIDISANNASSATTYHLIGNPYVSPININSFLTNANNANNIENYIYVWDPKMTNTSNGVGGIVTLTNNGTSFDPSTSGLSYANGTTELPSGMAFFIQKKSSNCTTCSLVFTES